MWSTGYAKPIFDQRCDMLRRTALLETTATPYIASEVF